MPTIGLTDDEHAAVTALLRCALEQDRFSRASTRCARRWQNSIRLLQMMRSEGR
jgi:hypothetical protein